MCDLIIQSLNHIITSILTEHTLRNEPTISIITVNYNGLGMTIDLLHSIERQSYKNVEVFVVDNASKEDPSLYLSKNFPKVRCIRSEKNLGFAGGNNLAVREAKGDFLFLIITQRRFQRNI